MIFIKFLPFFFQCSDDDDDENSEELMAALMSASEAQDVLAALPLSVTKKASIDPAETKDDGDGDGTNPRRKSRRQSRRQSLKAISRYEKL